MTRVSPSPWPMRASPPDAERWLEGLPAAVIGVDAGSRIRFVNAAAADLLPVGGLQGRRLDDVFGAASPLISLVERGAGGRVVESGIALATREAPHGRVAAAASPVGDQGYVALIIAPMPRPRGQAHSRAQTAARTLAHEVRNPLAGIRAAAQLIGRAADPDTAQLARLICDEVDRVNRLTERIDPLSAPPPPSLADVNVHEALDRVRKLLQSSAPHVAISERYDPSLPLLRGDLDQLIQAFLNIAKNAVEALTGVENGEIAFATAYRPGVRVRSGPDDAARAQLEVQIIDNGPGLDPEIAERAFEPLATTKAGGMGLGLTLAADIVARHGGHIEVESGPGRTAFRILLPIQPESEQT